MISRKFPKVLEDFNNLCKVRSLFKDGKQTAGCTNFCTETRLRRPVSVRNSIHPAVCLPSLKRERTLVVPFQIQLGYTVFQL